MQSPRKSVKRWTRFLSVTSSVKLLIVISEFAPFSQITFVKSMRAALLNYFIPIQVSKG